MRFVAEAHDLSRAVARRSHHATVIAVQHLLDTGHVAAMRVMRGGKVLAAMGVKPALTPISGTITTHKGRPIGSYVLSTTGDQAYVATLLSLIGGDIRIDSPTRVLEGSMPHDTYVKLPSGGEITLHHTRYSVYSFPGHGYPGGPLTISILHPVAGNSPLCGSSTAQTVANTIGSVGEQIYHQESMGRQLSLELQRAAHDHDLLRAVARGKVHAAEVAIDHLLNQHIVRIRVLRHGHFLADVGGPRVLAPVRAPLSYHHHFIGQVEISIQDDLGYLLLVHRLLGAEVIMWRGARQVISSLGRVPVTPPGSGPYVYGGQSYTVFSFEGRAFPSGLLQISLLIPNPYQ